MSFIPYHLEELEAALASPANGANRPILTDSDRAILDIGCGIGQSFIAWGRTDRMLVGMDVDEDAIREGMARVPWAQMLLQGAERIPYPVEMFDLVMSRVSLPYTNIPKALREIRRVLKPGGRIWLTLHSREHARACVGEVTALKKRLFLAYVMLNGELLKRFGFVIPWKPGIYNSWQDTGAFVAMLGRYGFEASASIIGTQTVVEGVRR